VNIDMSTIETKLAAMGYTLPQPRDFPSPNRRGCVRVGAMLFLSGHGPHHPDMKAKEHGKLGLDISEGEGYEAAKITALTMLATIKRELGDLDRVKQVVRLFGMVNCTPEFTTMPRVIDGASDLFYELFGPQAGCHARTAVGMASLPRGQAVEINGEFEIAP
jgi:enamine deaminase RidA (YjgF/YER057c/UK114 family)